ncbi:MAG: cyclase family protein [Proteobacteria bacterium]|nr:cyclase family protein [Pseudomonadota bacterium]
MADTNNVRPLVIDLTHTVPTYRALVENPTMPDMDRPWSNVPSFATYGGHAVLGFFEMPINLGHIESGRLVISEHHGTHMNAPNHFINNETSQEPTGIPIARRKQMHEVPADWLVEVIDIAARVQAELDKNGGIPSPDLSVTDFGNDSGNVVTAADIDAVADQLLDGCWIAINLGWSRFFYGAPDMAGSAYINGFNDPGLTPEAVDRLLQIAKQKKIRIGGTVIDNISTETGQSAKGEDEKRTNSLTAHVRLLQHDILMVENAANLDALSETAKTKDCTLVVGAIKVARGTGAQARVLALCQ